MVCTIILMLKLKYWDQASFPVFVCANAPGVQAKEVMSHVTKLLIHTITMLIFAQVLLAVSLDVVWFLVIMT